MGAISRWIGALSGCGGCECPAGNLESLLIGLSGHFSLKSEWQLSCLQRLSELNDINVPTSGVPKPTCRYQLQD